MSVLDDLRAMHGDDLRGLLAVATDDELAELEVLLAVEARELDERAELDRLEREHEGRVAELEDNPELWLRSLLSGFFRAGFAAHHRQLWKWVWAIQPGKRSDPFVGIWPRGGAKSTSAEAACVALGARGIRRYVLYVSGTQDLADDHVKNIGQMMESATIAAAYPELGKPAVSKTGALRAWRRNRLTSASGFTVDAVGLDGAFRGRKDADQRPDFIVIDDVDSKYDKAEATEKKILRITNDILGGGDAQSATVLAIQNVIHEDSVFARLADGRADFLKTRIVSGPIPAVRGLETVRRRDDDGRDRDVIASGVATWEGQSLMVCQAQIDDWGLSAFRSEAQHDIEAPPGGMFDHLDFAVIRVKPSQVPTLLRVAVWVDPAVTDTDQSDAHGVQADGLGVDGLIYRLRSWEQRATPLTAMKKGVRWAVELGATSVGVETDQGGDTWESVFREAVEAVARDLLEERRPDLARAVRRLSFDQDKAGAGHGPKAARAALMLGEGYEGAANIRHVEGTHGVLERALRRFPKTKPFDLVDAAYWSWRDLAGGDNLQVGSWSTRQGLVGRR